MLSTIFKGKASSNESSASTGLWHLALNRLKSDRIAVVSFCGVVLFHLARFIDDRRLPQIGIKEVAVSYAPPTFLGADAESDQIKANTESAAALPENPVDPLKDIIQQLNVEIQAEQQGSSAIDSYGMIDPLAEDMRQIDQQLEDTY